MFASKLDVLGGLGVMNSGAVVEEDRVYGVIMPLGGQRVAPLYPAPDKDDNATSHGSMSLEATVFRGAEAEQALLLNRQQNTLAARPGQRPRRPTIR